MRKLVFICMYLSLTIPCAAGTIYVSVSAAGANTGSTWADAYNYLQDALADAQYDDQIWVAEGTYTPDANSLMPDGNGDRMATFQLIDGVGLYGGFPNTSDPNFQDRDPNQHETILSGDLFGNDDPNTQVQDLFFDPTRIDNSYLVVTAYRTDPNSVLDGMTITRGRALNFSGGIMCLYGSSPTIRNCIIRRNSGIPGGGMTCYRNCDPKVINCSFIDNFNGGMVNMDNSSPTVTDCTFTGNLGGGMYNDSSSPTVTDCTFTGNLGGGMYNDSSSPTVTGCTFSGNSADGGGGMFNDSSNPEVTNCTFSNNSADAGGGMYNFQNSPTITGCNFSGNSAELGGGICNDSSSPEVTGCNFSGNSADGGAGMFNDSASPTVTNCTFAVNSADIAGGGMVNVASNPTVANSIFIGNSTDNNGGGMYNVASSNPIVTGCILWGNTADNDNEFFGTASVSYSCVQGGFPGLGNIDTDPLFVDTTSSDPNLWDFHLKSAGWRWDNDANDWTWDDVTSRCIDAGNPGSPLADEPMTLYVDPTNREGENLRINMGAYGGTAKASMPPYDWALLADLTNDGIVNLADFANQAIDWQNTDPQQPGDLNRDGTVDLNDALLMVNDWLKTTSWY